ncbi:hypothetical protein [Haloferula sp.]|uniref:hypothetical protein n=1 Tax=Haloferula sp. TaxID=2497595 RepID=UPI003C7556BC
MKTHATEQAPALPTALLEDLTRTASSLPSSSRQSSLAGLFESLRSMMASPAFGGAAAAVMVLAIASAVMLRPDASAPGETFRGAGSFSAANSARVILVGASTELQHELEAISDLEDGVFSSVSSTEGLEEIKGALVIVDFKAQTITGINAKGEVAYSSDLPASASSTSLEIALALSRL